MFGGIAAACLAIWILPEHSFRVLYAIGAIPLVTVVPLCTWLMPESPPYRRRREAPHGDTVKRMSITVLLRGRAGIAIALFCVANFCIGVIVFGLNTHAHIFGRPRGACFHDKIDPVPQQRQALAARQVRHWHAEQRSERVGRLWL